MVTEFGGGIVRRLALGVIIGLLGAVQVTAETLPPCRTTAGEEGLVFEAVMANVQSPVTYDEVRSGRQSLLIWRDSPQGPLVWPNPEPEATRVETLTFLAAGREVYECKVTVEAFDPALHRVEQIQSGTCAFRVMAGLSSLQAGHAQVLQVAKGTTVLGVGNPGISDYSALSAGQLYLLGKVPGVTVLASVMGPAEEVVDVSLCPIVVTEAADLLDGELCRDGDGAPIRLGRGETAIMPFVDSAGGAYSVETTTVGAPEIADFAYLDDRSGLRIVGKVRGSTTFIMFGDLARVAAACAVVVE